MDDPLLLLLCLLGLDLHDGGVVAGGLRQDEVMVMAVVVIPIMEDLVVVVGEAPQVLALIRIPFWGRHSLFYYRQFKSGRPKATEWRNTGSVLASPAILDWFVGVVRGGGNAH